MTEGEAMLLAELQGRAFFFYNRNWMLMATRGVASDVKVEDFMYIDSGEDAVSMRHDLNITYAKGRKSPDQGRFYAARYTIRFCKVGAFPSDDDEEICVMKKVREASNFADTLNDVYKMGASDSN